METFKVYEEINGEWTLVGETDADSAISAVRAFDLHGDAVALTEDECVRAMHNAITAKLRIGTLNRIPRNIPSTLPKQ